MQVSKPHFKLKMSFPDFVLAPFLFFVLIPSQVSARTLDFYTVGVSWVQWNENFEVSDGATSSKTKAQVYGQRFYLQRDVFKGQVGTSFDIGLLWGAANAASQDGSYKASQISTYGIAVGVRHVFRPAPSIVLSAGPEAIVRRLDFPKRDFVEKAQSGQSVNLNLVFDLRYRLTPRWEVAQSVGALIFQAQTYYGVGFAFKF